MFCFRVLRDHQESQAPSLTRAVAAFTKSAKRESAGAWKIALDAELKLPRTFSLL
jgi:hypothetical protein